LRTFQFLCCRRSSHGSFLASLRSFSSSVDMAGPRRRPPPLEETLPT
jgi:hypothetical protein